MMLGGPPEPAITINGVALNDAQAMTMRVAVMNFLTMLQEPEFREPLGAVGDNYEHHLSTITTLMVKHVTGRSPPPESDVSPEFWSVGDSFDRCAIMLDMEQMPEAAAKVRAWKAIELKVSQLVKGR